MVDEDSLIATLRSLYNERPDDITEDEIELRIKKNDVVCGLWPAPDKPGGFGYLALTGEGYLEKYMASRQPGKMRIAVVPCRSYDEAMKLQRMYGNSQQ
ncbi:MAG: hypothetical protein ABSA90_12540 [Xanthobacteraceae bacterium]|jgi:hypothetical protein